MSGILGQPAWAPRHALEQYALCCDMARLELAYPEIFGREGLYSLLSALTRRVPLADACAETRLDVPAEAASIEKNVGVRFQSWAAHGLIRDVLV